MSLANEDADLDNILDSALAEFDVGPARRSCDDVTPCGRENGSATSAEAKPGVQPAGGLTCSEAEPNQAASDAKCSVKVDGGAPKTHVPPEDERAVKAFEEALKSLDNINVDEEFGSDGKFTEEEDLKLVEEFMKSLGAELEKAGMPGDVGPSNEGQAGSATTSGDVSRELESLFGGTEAFSEHRARHATSNVDSINRPESAGPVDAGGVEFEKIVETVVGELLSKDVLKGPMEQMRDAYARWLPEREDKLSSAELTRFRKQRVIVERICATFERTDCKTADILNLLQEMQDTGAPPAEVMRQIGDDETTGNGSSSSSGHGASNGERVDVNAELDKLANCPVQ